MHHAAWLLPLLGCVGLVDAPPAIRMSGIAVGMFLYVKTHLAALELAAHRSHSGLDWLLWFVAWPGLNTRFFSREDIKAPSTAEWSFAFGKIFLGAVLFLWVAPFAIQIQLHLGAWIGMIGLGLILHFGVIHVLALVFQSLGRPVVPIMQAPLLSTSVSEFWSKRWNLAFRDYAHRTIFIPLAKWIGPRRAFIGVFAFSGLVHEAAISIPARGGFGLPLAFFALQLIAVQLERRLAKQGIRLSGSRTGTLWCIAWIAAPAPLLLFHSAFLEQVVRPIVEGVAKLQGFG